jgi:hypothetical protein
VAKPDLGMADAPISDVKGDTARDVVATTDIEKLQAISNSVIKEDVARGWTHYIWDTFEKSPQERRFLFKVDGAILTIECLGVFHVHVHASVYR